MECVPEEEQADFPSTGARARQLKRFERDLEAWLSTPEGRFAAFTAGAAVRAGQVAGAERS